ncbi:UNVERIFIED_CONTAM: hypothetical protein Sangu_2155200 [Sesamum angustifolium]|uniref:Uncharacterized protein n=1 Tax=Sesamum angustifolium TaxID=2727405 RepID=A0AAW2LG20_9LAMI
MVMTVALESGRGVVVADSQNSSERRRRHRPDQLRGTATPRPDSLVWARHHHRWWWKEGGGEGGSLVVARCHLPHLGLRRSAVTCRGRAAAKGMPAGTQVCKRPSSRNT